MGIPRFHVQELAGQIARLSDQEAVHAARSRRLAVGEQVILFDGAGREASGHIAAMSRSTVEVAFEAVLQRARPRPALTLAVALPKGPRQEVLLEKCTELGVAAIVPLLSERAICSASEHKLGRWRRTTIEAAKQSGQAWLPELHSPETLAQALLRIPTYGLAVFAATEISSRPFSIAKGSGPLPVTSILAFVGPEGGWTQQELEMLAAAGCQPISLGPNILRIETAAIALAAIVHLEQRNVENEG